VLYVFLFSPSIVFASAAAPISGERRVENQNA